MASSKSMAVPLTFTVPSSMRSPSRSSFNPSDIHDDLRSSAVENPHTDWIENYSHNHGDEITEVNSCSTRKRSIPCDVHILRTPSSADSVSLGDSIVSDHGAYSRSVDRSGASTSTTTHHSTPSSCESGEIQPQEPPTMVYMTNYSIDDQCHSTREPLNKQQSTASLSSSDASSNSAPELHGTIASHPEDYHMQAEQSSLSVWAEEIHDDIINRVDIHRDHPLTNSGFGSHGSWDPHQQQQYNYDDDYSFSSPCRSYQHDIDDDRRKGCNQQRQHSFSEHQHSTRHTKSMATKDIINYELSERSNASSTFVQLEKVRIRNDFSSCQGDQPSNQTDTTVNATDHGTTTTDSQETEADFKMNTSSSTLSPAAGDVDTADTNQRQRQFCGNGKRLIQCQTRQAHLSSSENDIKASAATPLNSISTKTSSRRPTQILKTLPSGDELDAGNNHGQKNLLPSYTAKVVTILLLPKPCRVFLVSGRRIQITRTTFVPEIL